jgi:hypothetical protein
MNNLSSSPSLNEYKNGIPNKPRDPSARRRIFRFILLGLLVIAVGMILSDFLQSDAAALLAGKGSLTGQAVDSQGNALNVTVFVMGVDRPVQVGADGSFKYENIPAGQRSLVLTYNGTAAEYPVQVQAGTTVNVGQLIFKVVTPSP